MLLRHINYFLAVARNQSFTRAAAALHVSQPALSQQIKQLEDSLGAKLFDRTGRTIRLTDVGEVYFHYARRALQDLDEGKRAIHDVADLSRGSLRVAVTPTFTAYLVGPLVKAFHDRYPNVTLTIHELPQERMETMLLDDELDIGIAFDEAHSHDINARRLLDETLALVVGRDHPLAKRRIMNLDTLNELSLVLLSTEFSTREQIDQCCLQHGIRPRVSMEVNSVSAVIEIILRTTLSTLLPAMIAFEHEELKAITLDPPLLQRTAVLMRRKRAYETAAARAFIDLASKAAAAAMKHTRLNRR
ncbi:transcriptional regulator CynR [Paralcaligenes ureilyticus]|uniref:LysR family transcriptional regulator n=1 Tax=Paralcaligenes ureilyticus TaxID=627131 RepID=A0A4R3LVC7_9BURK|nr:transcriptional regulator CynR [Paralcaligenes ureilyticus]TCT04521.1 LysR family transcriptional regulator [Paralcaligenes ureilyticus]